MDGMQAIEIIRQLRRIADALEGLTKRKPSPSEWIDGPL